MDSICKTMALKIYQDVIEDVMQHVRELFLEDGVDEQVLQELKQTWKSKLLASKAVDSRSDMGGVKKQPDVTNSQAKQTLIPNHLQTSINKFVDNKRVPVQIRLPGNDGGQRVLTIQVPPSILEGNQLQKILNGPVLTATTTLSQSLASSLLQQHVEAALNNQQKTVATGSTLNIVQTDGTVDEVASNSDDEMGIQLCSTDINSVEQKVDYLQSSVASFSSPNKQQINYKVVQADGAVDTSDEDRDESEDDEGDDDEEEDDQEVNKEVSEDEPLNSEDDVTDEELLDLFDTDNVVVCQFDRITRSRNKWKFHLKYGIMNLNGEDYVFQVANGDAEW